MPSRIYGKIRDGKFIRAVPYREELSDGRGYVYKWISDEDLASGEYKEVLVRGSAHPNAEALVRAGRMTAVYEDVGDYIVCTYSDVAVPAAHGPVR